MRGHSDHSQSMATASFSKTENFFVAIFSYQSISVDGNTVATEQQVVVARTEQQQVATSYEYGRQMERY